MGDESKNMPGLTFVILTLNEEEFLQKALNSLPNNCTVLVVDSYSTDGTEEIAVLNKVTWVQHKFTDYSEQRNFALSQVKTQWVFMLDADEQLDPQLKRALEQQDWTKLRPAGYRVQRKMMFMNQKLRFGKSSDRPVRLFCAEQASYAGVVHERLNLPGERLNYKGWIKHYSYQDLSHYFRIFNRYTSLIADTKLANKRHLSLWHVARPWWEFFQRYILRLGFLDGYPGYCYALISSFYAYIKYAKAYESQNYLSEKS